MKLIKTIRSIRRPALAAAFLAVAFSGGVAAQILECVDAKGRKEFANQCPPGTTEARKIMRSGVGTPSSGGAAAAPAPATAPAAKPAAGGKSVAEQEVEFRKRQAERQDAEAKGAKSQAEAEARRKQCEQAQAQLKAYESGQRMGRFDPKTGERQIIGDAERPAEMAQARKDVENSCK
ncbi:MAG: hypothetical protein ACREUW_09115 [Burkholderiales bacterium]